MNTLERLSHQIVRDLFWIFSSPPLIQQDTFPVPKIMPDESWKKAIALSPEKISRFMENKNLKMLGPYFEALWEFYLEHNPQTKLIAKNVQVFASNKTLGEFDFIYLDKTTDQYCHLEVAVKYFLGLDVSTNKAQQNVTQQNGDGLAKFSAMNQWIGPNANDRLDKKYIKMHQHQSQLSQTPEGRTALERLEIPASSAAIRTEICLLGYLFYPLNDETEHKPMLPPENAHPNHNKGYWLRVSQLEELLPYSNLWEITDKPFWLAPCQRQFRCLKARTEIIDDIKRHFSEYQRPLLLSEFIEVDKVNTSNHVGFEGDKKYFVVSEAWPKQSVS